MPGPVTASGGMPGPVTLSGGTPGAASAAVITMRRVGMRGCPRAGAAATSGRERPLPMAHHDGVQEAEMSPIPDRFRAYVVEHTDGSVLRGLRPMTPTELPDGDVEVRVTWSSVNFKDGLAAQPDGRVARISPLIPGIDLAGVVVSSRDAAFWPGMSVLANGYELGTSRHGGYAEFARLPAGWVVPMPGSLDERLSMAIGTAGFTAAMGVVALEAHGLRPDDGPVLVTGAAGGLGRHAVGILAARGYEAWAATGKPEQADRLVALGAAGILPRSEVTAESTRPLESGRWAGAIDSVGAPTLPYILRTLRAGGAVAACGNAGGASFATTVLPFILRGVALLGMDSVAVPIEERRTLWARLATDLRPLGLGEDIVEIGLEELDGALDAIVAGRARGRWIVRVAA
jgi:acrylyl-CoA reductase (NADPH)